MRPDIDAEINALTSAAIGSLVNHHIVSLCKHIEDQRGEPMRVGDYFILSQHLLSTSLRILCVVSRDEESYRKLIEALKPEFEAMADEAWKQVRALVEAKTKEGT